VGRSLVLGAKRAQVHDNDVTTRQQLVHRGSPGVVEAEELVDPVSRRSTSL